MVGVQNAEVTTQAWHFLMRSQQHSVVLSVEEVEVESACAQGSANCSIFCPSTDKKDLRGDPGALLARQLPAGFEMEARRLIRSQRPN